MRSSCFDALIFLKLKTDSNGAVESIEVSKNTQEELKEVLLPTFDAIKKELKFSDNDINAVRNKNILISYFISIRGRL